MVTLLTMKEREENMHISYKPLWHTLVERGLTTNMIANMGKGKEINFDMLVPICK